MYSYGPPHMAGQKQDDQLEHTFSSYERILDVALKTYQRGWTIGRSGERGSGISDLAARLDDDDDDSTYGICGKRREREVHTCSMSVRHLELSPLTSVVTRHAPISSGITLNDLGIISLSCYFQHIHTNNVHYSNKKITLLVVLFFENLHSDWQMENAWNPGSQTLSCNINK